MFDVDQFVADCRAALGERQPALAVKEVLERTLSAAPSIEGALGAAERGGVVPLHHAADLTVLHIVWPPGVSLFPHDHRMWAANGIYGGREDNVFYRRSTEGIVRSGGKELDAGDVVLLGSDVIHSVSNPRRTCTAAIHVYGGDFFGTPRSEWDAETLEEQPFAVEHLRQALADADEVAGAEAARSDGA